MRIILYLSLLGISFFDWKYLLIPDLFHAVLIINCLFMFGWEGFLKGIPNGLFLAVPLYLLRFLMNKILKEDCLGGGDIKLVFSLGIYFDLYHDIYALLFACISGLAMALFYIRKQEKAFPFGPCICLGFFLIMIGKKPV